MKASSSYLLWATALFLPTVTQAQTQSYFTNTVNERAVSCPQDPNQIGYKHVTDVNKDQQAELDRIASGEPARKPYIFPFCNSFKYLMDQEILEVLLDDITFVCGYNGTNQELCVLEGGDVQVNIAVNAPNKNIVFQGMSFFGFTGISIKAYAASNSKITFNDASWKNFANGAIAVHQTIPQGGTPMEVEINKATFESGYGSNLFDNVGGVLSFTDMSIIENVRVDSMIRTSAGGTTTLAKVDAQFSDITVSANGYSFYKSVDSILTQKFLCIEYYSQRLTHTMQGGKQTVNGVTVADMLSMGSIFFVEGTGSVLTVSSVTVKENFLAKAYQDQTSRNFNVLIATDSSTASISTVSVTDCDGVDVSTF